MKILILVLYYNRPILVRRALESVIKANQYHQDWHLLFGDDGSPIPGEPIAREVLHEHLDRVTFVNSGLSFEDKVRGGLVHGRYANEIISKSDADLAITLCDDDALVPTYLRDISRFFEEHPEVMYAWSNIHLYNPLLQSPENVNNVTGRYNEWEGAINPVNKCDCSQVAFRTISFQEHGVRCDDTTFGAEGMPWLKSLDATILQALFDKYGPAPYTGLVAQYKGIHDYQLVWNKRNGIDGLSDYVRKVEQLGGKVF